MSDESRLKATMRASFQYSDHQSTFGMRRNDTAVSYCAETLYAAEAEGCGRICMVMVIIWTASISTSSPALTLLKFQRIGRRMAPVATSELITL